MSNITFSAEVRKIKSMADGTVSIELNTQDVETLSPELRGQILGMLRKQFEVTLHETQN